MAERRKEKKRGREGQVGNRTRKGKRGGATEWTMDSTCLLELSLGEDIGP